MTGARTAAPRDGGEWIRGGRPTAAGGEERCEGDSAAGPGAGEMVPGWTMRRSGGGESGLAR